MVMCKNCGIELTEDHIYCPQCGYAIGSEDEEEEDEVDEEDFMMFEEEEEF